MKRIGKALLVAASGVLLSITAGGCLARPVTEAAPSTKDSFTNKISQQAVDKVDILFAIDNSQSMGDKQAILREAVPNLLQGLLNPACVSRTTRAKTGKLAKYDGNREDNWGCDKEDEPEFHPITDLHIGIVSSSLGDFGSFKDGAHVCDPRGLRMDDGAKLLRYKADGKEDTVNAPDDFLAWFPSTETNSDPKQHPKPKAPIGDLDTLNGSFESLVSGVDQTGCGFESQLESVYRFLIAPDPWDRNLKFDATGRADIGEGVDDDILRERAAFLRPDSLVAVIMLTDEEDSSADPLAVNGFGYAFMAQRFPGSTVGRSPGAGTTAPRATSACAGDPGSPDCTSCGFGKNCGAGDTTCQKIAADPNCRKNDGFYAPEDDDVNVRFHRMKERYGVDPQYPIRRYVDGFKQALVPNRAAEHTVTTGADGKRAISDYRGDGTCTNPLFAAKLPTSSSEEICKLARGDRTADKVFFAVVGGVPHQLLHFDPSSSDAATNSLSDKDWQKILGKDPLRYDFTGIDPHMIQSIAPRAALAAGGDASSPRGQNGSDPIHGREWNTAKSDLQYACTFDLPKQRDCSAVGASCDCGDLNGGPASNTPLCAADGSPTQIKAKAYPTIRELEVVRALGDQGVAASLCPIQLDQPEAPDYGYKPAIAAIVARLGAALNSSCLPRSIRNEDDKDVSEIAVSCLVLAELGADSGQTCEELHLATPDAAILKTYRDQLEKEHFDTTDLESRVCRLEQRPVAKGESCAADGDLAWCYVENDGAKKPGGRCAQAIIFSAGTSVLPKAKFSLQCIQQLKAGEAAGDDR